MRIISCLIFFFSAAFAAEAPGPCVEIKLGQETVACLHKGLGSISVFERRDTVQERLEAFAQDYSLDVESIHASESEGSVVVLAKDTPLISFHQSDAREAGVPSADELARQTLSKIKASVISYREKRSPQALSMGFLYTLAATAALSLLIWAIVRVQKFSERRIAFFTDNVLQTLKGKSFHLINPHRVRSILLLLLSTFKVVAVLVLVYVYIPMVLSFFPWTAKWAPEILGYILVPVKNILLEIFAYLPNIFFIALIGAITHFFLKFVRLVFMELEKGTITFPNFHKEWAQPTFRIAAFLTYAIAFVMIFPYLPGSSSPAFQGVSVFLGVLVSFGSGSSIANIISGVLLTYMRPFKIGDRVKIADTVGDIIEKSFLVTRIKTIKNVEITVPNSMVLNSHIINYSTSADEEGLILNTTVTMGYEIPWPKVHQLLKEAALRTERIEKSIEPFVFQTALNDSYVSYELNAFTREANSMAQIYSDLHRNILDVFHEAGIEMVSPIYQAIRDGSWNTMPREFHRSGTPEHPLKVSLKSDGSLT